MTVVPVFVIDFDQANNYSVYIVTLLTVKMESGYIVFEAFHVFAQTNICLFILFNILVQFMHVNGNKWSIPFTAVYYMFSS